MPGSQILVRQVAGDGSNQDGERFSVVHERGGIGSGIFTFAPDAAELTVMDVGRYLIGVGVSESDALRMIEEARTDFRRRSARKDT